jgi:hypothetical protein
MAQYQHLQENEDQPFWQIVIQYQPEGAQYSNFPDGIERITGVGLSFLTKKQAEKKVAELNQKSRQ